MIADPIIHNEGTLDDRIQCLRLLKNCFHEIKFNKEDISILKDIIKEIPATADDQLKKSLRAYLSNQVIKTLDILNIQKPACLN